MKKTLLLLLVAIFTFASNNSSAQKIKPGVKVGKIKLGMSKSDFIDIVGTEESTNNYAEEVDDYEMSGYNTDIELPFFIGFDTVVQFNNGINSEVKIPVFKGFFKDDKLVYLILTSYGYAESLYSKCKVKSGLRFKSSSTNVKKVFGEPYAPPFEDPEWQYLELGVSFAIDEDVVRAIHIYKPLSASEISTYKSKM